MRYRFSIRRLLALALPVVELARGLGWQTEVVDPQARPASLSRFALADKQGIPRVDEGDSAGVAATTVLPRRGPAV